MAVHKVVSKKLVEYLRHLDLSTDEINVYLYLLPHGPQTVLSLSRGLKTGRTKLYPQLDELAQKKLVTVHERHYGTSYEASDPSVLGFLVAEHVERVQSLQAGFPSTIHTLSELQQTSPNASKIIDYKGLDGLKQMYWNISQANEELFVLELPAIQKQLGKHLREKLQLTLNKKPVVVHALTNQKNPITPVRRIDPALFKITTETYIYNNIVSLMQPDGNGGVCGTEIHNQMLSTHYKQMCKLLCSQAVTR